MPFEKHLDYFLLATPLWGAGTVKAKALYISVYFLRKQSSGKIVGAKSMHILR